MKRASIVAGMVLVVLTVMSVLALPVGAASLNVAANSIVVRAQDVTGGQVYVDSVTAAQSGWLLIHTDASGAPGRVIGFTRVIQGLNQGLAVDVRMTNAKGDDNITPTLWATLAADPSADDPFASPSGDVEQLGSVATVAFSSSLAGGNAPSANAPALASNAQLPTTGGQTISAPAVSAPAVNAPAINKIVVRSQDTNSGQLVVDSVTAAQDGWVFIRNDANGAPGTIIGWVPVHQGTSGNLTVDLNLTDQNGNELVTPTLWATLAADPNATAPFATPGDDAEGLGSLVAAPFSSTAP